MIQARTLLACLVVGLLLWNPSMAAGGSGASRFKDAPCWLAEPSSDGRIGSIGVARAIGMVPGRPYIIARQRAAQGVLGYFGTTVTPDELDRQVTREGDEVVLGGTVVHFTEPYVAEGEIFQYAYAGEKAPEAGACPSLTAANPTRCEPAWTCYPAQEEAGVLGISYRSASLSRQFALAQENAFSLLGYAYGARVQGVERYLTAGDSVGAVRLRLQDLEVSRSDKLPTEIRVYVKAVRFWGDTLLMWVVSPDLPAYPAPKDLAWTTEVPDEFQPAAIGSAGMTASGLLSDQVDLAVERGIMDLAKQAGVSVRAQDVARRGTGRRLYVQGVEQNVDVELRARVTALHLDASRRISVLVVPTR